MSECPIRPRKSSMKNVNQLTTGSNDSTRSELFVNPIPDNVCQMMLNLAELVSLILFCYLGIKPKSGLVFQRCGECTQFLWNSKYRFESRALKRHFKGLNWPT